MKTLPVNYTEVEQLYSQTIAKGVRSIAFTATNSGEGSSMLAVALAKRCEVVGKKVLLIDFNLLNPSLHDFFSVQPENNFLSLNSALDRVMPLPNSQIALLSAPINNAYDPNLRDKVHLEKLLNVFLEHYDHIILDTSPLAAVNRSNLAADMVCSVAEATMLVVLAKRTSLTRLQVSVEKLQAAQANLVGTVLNDQFNPTLAEQLRDSTRWVRRVSPTIMYKMHDLLKNSVIFNNRP